MRWLLLGYGDLPEKRVATALHKAEGSELTAVWGRNSEKCRDFAKRHRIAKYFSGVDGLASALRENVDAVYVCTPVDTHLDYTCRALEAGKHVLCEKPMALNIDQCQAMVDLTVKEPLKLGIAYYRRLFPSLMRIKEIIDTRLLGRIVYVNMTFQEWYDPKEDDPQNWRLQPERSGGGVSYDVGSHRLDLLSYWFDHVRSIKTQAINLVHDYPAEDTATFLMELANYQNAPAVLNVSWGCGHGVDTLVLTGSEMTLVSENLSGPEFKLNSRKGLTVETFTGDENVHRPLVEDFVQAVKNDKDPICSGWEGMKTNKLLESIKDQS